MREMFRCRPFTRKVSMNGTGSVMDQLLSDEGTVVNAHRVLGQGSGYVLTVWIRGVSGYQLSTFGLRPQIRIALRLDFRRRGMGYVSDFKIRPTGHKKEQ